MKARIASLDKPPVERLCRLADGMGLVTGRFKDTCTGPDVYGKRKLNHKGKPLFTLTVEGQEGLVRKVFESDPGLEFNPDQRHGVHPTIRRWWSIL